MKVIQVLALVEGQTEEAFVKEVLNHYFASQHIFLNPIILTTKKVKHGPNYKGGLVSYGQFRRDAIRLLEDKNIWLTSFIDYYGLPDDFPSLKKSKELKTPVEQVKYLEDALTTSINHDRFIPYIQLHEFEALLFASDSGVKAYFSHENAFVQGFEQIMAEFPNPEEINDNPETAPSKRLLALFPKYEKVLDGNLIALENGMEVLLKKCPHFAEWIRKLEALAGN